MSRSSLGNAYDGALKNRPLSADELAEEDLVREYISLEARALKDISDAQQRYAYTITSLNSLTQLDPAVKSRLNTVYTNQFTKAQASLTDAKQVHQAVLRTQAQTNRVRNPLP